MEQGSIARKICEPNWLKAPKQGTYYYGHLKYILDNEYFIQKMNWIGWKGHERINIVEQERMSETTWCKPYLHYTWTKKEIKEDTKWRWSSLVLTSWTQQRSEDGRPWSSPHGHSNEVMLEGGWQCSPNAESAWSLHVRKHTKNQEFLKCNNQD